MATDKYEICNLALSRLGARAITSFVDGTVEGAACGRIYDSLSKEVLRAHPWKFAKIRVTLPTPDVTAPAFDWGNYFTLPADCLRVLEVGLPGERWSTEGGKLLYDAASADIIYLSWVTDTTKYDVNFTDALAYKLAHDLTYTLVQSITLRDQMDKDYKQQLAQARSFSAQEGSSPRVYADCWLNSRY